MIAEAVRDLLPLVSAAPFKRVATNASEWQSHQAVMKEKWAFYGSRFEAILLNNNPHLAAAAKEKEKNAKSKGKNGNKKPAAKDSSNGSVNGTPTKEGGYLVGNSLTYADVLVAHITTWLFYLS